MSGYTGNPDAEAEHAAILAENGVYAAQQALRGPVLNLCLDCGDQINPRRVLFLASKGMRCIRCLNCQQADDLRPKAHIKMLDRIL